jgi:diaminohydroxyphosphoribosylaminopyrimidine deaminase/5-amino-6-(5-phosphoribosylamino)uracil reductase
MPEQRPASIGLAEQDVRWMRATLDFSRRNLGLTAPNPAVGAIIVKHDVVLGRGITQPGGRPHAEQIALAQAGEAARGATIYVTLEPCARRSRTGDGPSCTDAILAAGIARVVIAAPDPSPFAAGEGERRLRGHGVDVATGVLAGEAAAFHLGHILRVTAHRPLVQLKLAATSDGFAATRDHKPLAITGEMARSMTHMLRARSDAIMVGIGTVIADDPQLTCRLPGLRGRSPVRVVLDGALRTPMLSQLVKTAREVPTWIVASVGASVEREWALRSQGVDVLRVGTDSAGRLDLADSLGLLADWGITRLMVEGGPTLAEALAEADLLDEAVLFSGGWKLGGQSGGQGGLPALGPALDKLASGQGGWRKHDERVLGPDLMRSFERLR